MEKSPKKNKEVSVRTTEEITGAKESNRPIKTLRDGDVSASIWARTIVKLEPKTYYSITFERSYVGADGIRKYAKSFNLADLPKIATLCQQVEAHIVELQAMEASQQEA